MYMPRNKKRERVYITVKIRQIEKTRYADLILHTEYVADAA